MRAKLVERNIRISSLEDQLARAQAPSPNIAPGQSMIVDSLRAIIESSRSKIAQLERELALKDEVIAESSARYRALLARVDELSKEKPARYGHSVAAPRPSSML